MENHNTTPFTRCWKSRSGPRCQLQKTTVNVLRPERMIKKKPPSIPARSICLLSFSLKLHKMCRGRQSCQWGSAVCNSFHHWLTTKTPMPLLSDYLSREGVCWCSPRKPNLYPWQPLAAPGSWKMIKWQSLGRSWMWNLIPMPNLLGCFTFLFFIFTSFSDFYPKHAFLGYLPGGLWSHCA